MPCNNITPSPFALSHRLPSWSTHITEPSITKKTHHTLHLAHTPHPHQCYWQANSLKTLKKQPVSHRDELGVTPLAHSSAHPHAHHTQSPAAAASSAQTQESEETRYPRSPEAPDA